MREVFANQPGGGFASAPGEMGEACVPADEDVSTFSGFAVSEVNLSIEDARCVSGTCLVNRFQGRVSCPGGNLEGEECFTPSGEIVSVDVQPQLVERPAGDLAHCSCRCDGPRQFGPFCECPDDMACVELFTLSSPEVDRGQGSYCVWR